MEIIFLAFVCMLSYLFILCKIFSLRFVCKTQVLWDILFTFGIPFLFMGTFSGMAVAFIAGLLFTITVWFLSSLITPKFTMLSFPYGKGKTNKNSSGGDHPTRSWYITMCNIQNTFKSSETQKEEMTLPSEKYEGRRTTLRPSYYNNNILPYEQQWNKFIIFYR